MVYATCSILRAENASQVEAFLARHSDFQLVPSDSTALPDCLRGTSMFSLTPHQNETDGFFAAVLERKPEADNETADL